MRSRASASACTCRARGAGRRRAGESDELRVLDATRHSRKLPRGALAGNRFVADVCATCRAIASAIDARMQAIARARRAQLFRRAALRPRRRQRRAGAGDVRRAPRARASSAACCCRPRVRSCSTAVLAERVTRGQWDRALDGEVWMLDGSRSVFGPEPLQRRARTRGWPRSTSIRPGRCGAVAICARGGAAGRWKRARSTRRCRRCAQGSSRPAWSRSAEASAAPDGCCRMHGEAATCCGCVSRCRRAPMRPRCCRAGRLAVPARRARPPVGTAGAEAVLDDAAPA